MALHAATILGSIKPWVLWLAGSGSTIWVAYAFYRDSLENWEATKRLGAWLAKLPVIRRLVRLRWLIKQSEILFYAGVRWMLDDGGVARAHCPVCFAKTKGEILSPMLFEVITRNGTAESALVCHMAGSHDGPYEVVMRGIDFRQTVEEATELLRRKAGLPIHGN